MAQLQKPTQERSLETQIFWDGIRIGELLLPRCRSCGRLIQNAKPFCAGCSSVDVEWVRCTGRGKVHSYVIRHGRHDLGPGSSAIGAEIIAVVEIDEGLRMLARITGITPVSVRVDMPVEIVFGDVEDGPIMFSFEPV